MSELKSLTNQDDDQCVSWLSKIYSFVKDFVDEKARTNYFSNYKIFLNQNDNFCHSKVLAFDKNIEEVYKQILLIYGYDIKNELHSLR